MKFLEPIRRAGRRLQSIWRSVVRLERDSALIREALGRIEQRQLVSASASDLRSHEFRVFSQWGEDGILAYLLRHVAVSRKVFVEFGVEDYTEANTRWMLVNEGWSGLVLDGSTENIAAIRRDPIYWRHNLKAVQAFITRENINDLLSNNGLTGEIGLLSVDIDGVDYWVWEAINTISPAIVVAEYNALFGSERAVTVPYDANFQRAKAHHSQSYYGASLAALISLGRCKGYAFVGSNSAGNNAFFIRRDLLRAPLREMSAAEGWVKRAFREARDAEGRLTFPSFEEEAAIVNALPLVEVEK
jgi:hypothetical protein